MEHNESKFRNTGIVLLFVFIISACNTAFSQEGRYVNYAHAGYISYTYTEGFTSEETPFDELKCSTTFYISSTRISFADTPGLQFVVIDDPDKYYAYDTEHGILYDGKVDGYGNFSSLWCIIMSENGQLLTDHLKMTQFGKTTLENKTFYVKCIE